MFFEKIVKSRYKFYDKNNQIIVMMDEIGFNKIINEYLKSNSLVSFFRAPYPQVDSLLILHLTVLCLYWAVPTSHMILRKIWGDKIAINSLNIGDFIGTFIEFKLN